ncbi:hypothetical protein AB0O28_19080 [Microbispora sp. NPDC088329]|uniref:hypothetical protein n=1 Tax=Microbispora sp. NPDC088329 TaxID=3154869 RepID=UPI003430AB9E
MDALFDIEAPPPAEPEPKESPDARRTRRQGELLARGSHPLGLSLGWPLRLHKEAAPADDRQAGGRRYGNCRFRQVLAARVRGFPKCVHPGSQSAESYETLGPLRVTHGAASDVRAWWPGCVDHEFGDPKVPGGMRWVPDPREAR